MRLTGPSRAIVATDHVTFEVELRIKYPGAEERQDTAFFFRTYTWHSPRDTTPLFWGYVCAAELRLEQLPRAIQATIVGVRLVAGSWPCTYGCRVSCSVSSAARADAEVELLNCPSLDEVKRSPVGSDGYFDLARNVVSVELQSTLEVAIHAIGGPSSHVEFPVQQYCQTSKASCLVPRHGEGGSHALVCELMLFVYQLLLTYYYRVNHALLCWSPLNICVPTNYLCMHDVQYQLWFLLSNYMKLVFCFD